MPGMNINPYGEIVREEWENTSRVRNNVTLDEFIIMPNHVLGKPVSGALSTIIRSFKSAVTKRINEIRNTPANPVRQKSFHDHIIRNEKSLHKIREYIRANPLSWDKDENNPNHNKAIQRILPAPFGLR